MNYLYIEADGLWHRIPYDDRGIYRVPCRITYSQVVNSMLKHGRRLTEAQGPTHDCIPEPVAPRRKVKA